MLNKKNLIVSILENFTIIMIILVLIQTFMEDFSVYADFSVETVNKIRLAAIIFDLYFTIEFLVRLISASLKKKGYDYFFYRNGWIDLLASIPLLLFISGPEVLSQVFHFNILSFGFMNTLRAVKVIKAIRVARILRLMRVLKILGKIKNIQSVMAQRHISKISAIVIASMIFFFIAVSVLQEVNVLPSLHNDMIKQEEAINNLYTNLYRLSDNKNISYLYTYSFKDFDNIILTKFNTEIKYESPNIKNKKYLYYKNKSLEEGKNTNDFLKEYEIDSPPDKLTIVYWRDEYFRKMALNNLINFILTIFVLIIITIIYSRHFAITVSDPIYVMRMGFEQKDYTYAVKLLEHYKDDDVFLLANDYNTRWLPAKIRKLSELGSNTESKLKIEDVIKK